MYVPFQPSGEEDNRIKACVWAGRGESVGRFFMILAARRPKPDALRVGVCGTLVQISIHVYDNFKVFFITIFRNNR